MNRNLRTNDRSGITLLFVISMIVLFLLMGTTFVVVANNFRRTAQAISLTTTEDISLVGERVVDRYINQALFDLLRGPDLDNSNSPLRGHSILADMYGYGISSFIDEIELIPAFDGTGQDQQFLRLRLIGAGSNVQTNAFDTFDLDPAATPFVIGNSILSGDMITTNDIGNSPGRFTGQLLSFVSGEMTGTTARIIDHQVSFTTVDATDPTHSFVIKLLRRPEGFDFSELDDFVVERAEATIDTLPTRVIINNRPFSGTGAGIFNPTANGSAITVNRHNFTGVNRNDFVNTYLALTGNVRNSFATNEPYDAVDEQNAFLARLESDGTVDIPSFAGDRFMTEFQTSEVEEFDLKGDGTDDVGIWMDLGFPSFEIQQGQRVKPLVTFLVADLDGRINLNFHGNRSQIAANTNFSGGTETTFLSGDILARGSGMGPAEVRLDTLFGGEELSGLLTGLPTEQIPGRYGFVDESLDMLSDGQGGGPVPGLGTQDVADGIDPFARFKNFGSPDGVLGRHFQSSLADYYGRFRIDYPANILVGKVPAGLPTADVTSSTLSYPELFNSPYETDASPPGQITGFSADQLFTFKELERIYRNGDTDLAGTGNSRLLDLLDGVTNPRLLQQNSRFLATAESWEVPTSPMEILRRTTVPTGIEPFRNENLVTKLYSILNTTNTSPTNSTATEDIGILENSGTAFDKQQLIMANISGFEPQLGTPTSYNRLPDMAMLSVDVREGRPFNINQPFGDGDDNNADGVIDDVNETNESLSRPTDAAGASSINAPFDHDNDSVAGGDSMQAKRQFARQLFVLILLTTEVIDRDDDGSIFDANGLELDPDDFFDFNNSGGVNLLDRLQYRRTVAQWVANVIDYRDADSVNTGLEFDLNPWDGWDVDEDISTVDNLGTFGLQNRFVVWGVERPELVLTEAIAMHDTRQEDTDEENVLSPGEMADSTDGGTDGDFDSRLVPEASAFFEVFNPWLGGNQTLPAELGTGGVDLTLRTPSIGGADQYPVWRVVVVRNGNGFVGGFDGDEVNFEDANFDFDQNSNFALDADEERFVRFIYFADVPTTATGDQFIGGKVYEPFSNNSVVIQPGQFGVIGSAGRLIDGIHTTFISRAPNLGNAPLNVAQTRRIELNPMDNQVSVWSTDGITVTTDASVLPIVSQEGGRSLGFSDPAGGYGPFSINQAGIQIPIVEDSDRAVQTFGAGGTLVFDQPIDQIVSDLSTEDDFYESFLDEEGLVSGLYVLVLQRVANPGLPWDEDLNPYLTVDSISCDLFAFNGIEAGSREAFENDPPLDDLFTTYERRAIRQDAEAGQQNVRFRMMWKTEFGGVDNPPLDNAGSEQLVEDMDASQFPHVLQRELDHSLGAMNNTWVDAASLGDLPFAWLNWNNRPFTNAYELMNVPFTSNFGLTSRFDVAQSEAGTFNVYEPANVNTDIRAVAISGDFPHLLNFFGGIAGNDDSTSLFRIFDYVEVPSRYVGTETFVNPSDYLVVPDPISGAIPPSPISRGFAAPYDFVSNYRVPGKFNLNTATDDEAFSAVVDPFNLGLTTRESWQEGVSGARGPLRPAVAANYSNSTIERDPVDTGLLRRTAGRSGPTVSPAFVLDLDAANDSLRNTARNPFYRYHPIQRMANSVTGRSSVFAVWIGVSLFEVDEDNTISDEPFEDDDGRRVEGRGFFIIDRSIPVAFEPGQDHNVADTIRLSSFLDD